MECSVFFREDGEDPIGSEPLIVRVTLLSKVQGFAFWVILLPLLFLKENRACKAGWIFLPFYAWMGLVAGAIAWTGPHGLGDVCGMLVPLQAVLAGLFLAGQRIQKWNGWLVLLAVIVFATLVHGVWMWIGPVENALYFASASSILFLLILVSFLLARLFCRRRYGGLRLSMGLLAAALLVSVLPMAVIAMVFRGAFWGGIGTMLAEMAIPSLLAGLIIYLLLMSFLAVPLSTEFFRSRLCGLLKLRRNVPTVVPLPEPTAQT